MGWLIILFILFVGLGAWLEMYLQNKDYKQRKGD